MRDANNKTELIHFFLRDWSSNRFVQELEGRTLFVNVESKFHKITSVDGEVCTDTRFFNKKTLFIL